MSSLRASIWAQKLPVNQESTKHQDIWSTDNKDVACFGMQPALTAGSSPFLCPNYLLWQQARDVACSWMQFALAADSSPFFCPHIPLWQQATGIRPVLCLGCCPIFLSTLSLILVLSQVWNIAAPQTALQTKTNALGTDPNLKRCGVSATWTDFGHSVSIKHRQPKSLSEHSWHKGDVQAKTLKQSCGQVRKKEQEERIGDRKSATQFGIMGCA
ncbi:hypothetical protein DFH09DRAFT_1084137 [Mycena vulgaris]|nr:hypothetical protein DFH09DRAFT_1084137 [Mycena vulgaris]